MADIISTADHDADDATRRAERDLGVLTNEVEHLAAQLADHTTTLEGIKEDKTWIQQRFEAIERDLLAIPKLPEDLTRTFSESLANLTQRIERMEAAAIDDDHTKAPDRRHDDDADDRRDREPEKRPNILDRLF